LSEDREGGYWYAYTDINKIDQLIQNLSFKILKESKLADELKTTKTKLEIKETPDEIQTYVNKESTFKDEEINLEDLKECVIDLDKKFSDFLKKGYKQWESDQRIEE